MTAFSDKPAKLCAPQGDALLVRSRLHDQLDLACRGSGAWVWGPPGAGKSALASSYLHCIAEQSGWIRMDPSDGDPAGFFHFLTLLAMKEWGIPLTPPSREHLLHPESFARRYFRDLFGALTGRTCLALDDYHVIDDTAPLHALIRIALEEVPAHVAMIIVSREPPQAEFARLLVGGTLSEIDGDDLRFSESESVALAGLRGLKDPGIGASANRRANGWAAGLVMLLQSEARGVKQPAPALAQDDGLLFRYFAKEVLGRLPAESQSFLLSTAFVPEISPAIARALGAEQSGMSVLEVMHASQLFVTRTGDPPVYRLHTLFGEFLRSEAKRRYDATQLTALLNDTGHALHAQRRPDDAIAAYQQAENWPHATTLVVQNAPRMLSEGRGRQVIEWVENFPAEIPRENVWLLFWLGMARSQVNARHGRLTLIEAHALFEVRGDIPGQTSACTGVLDALLMDADSLADLDPWLERLQTLFFAPQPFLDLATEARALTTTLAAHTRRHPDSRLSAHCARRLHALLGLGLDLNCEGEMVVALAHHHLIVLAFDDLRRLRPRLESLAHQEQIPSPTRVRLLIALAAIDWFANAQHQPALAALDRAQELARTQGPEILQSSILLYRAALLALAGHFGDARTHLERYSTQHDASRSVDSAREHLARGLIQLAQDDLDGGLQSASMAIAVGAATHIAPLIFVARLLRARLLTEAGKWSEAERELALAHASAEGKAPADPDSPLLAAYAYLRCGSMESALGAVRRGLVLAGQQDAVNLVLWFPRQVVPLLELALDRGVEIECAQRFIRAHHLAPSRRDREHWPWPVRIRTFGSFDIRIDDQPVAHSGRTQKRPLQLLQAVIALGGTRVPFNRLIGFLWPGSEGDDAERTLSVNLHRLRRLLTFDSALLVQDRYVSLNERCCWLDAWAFEDVSRRVVDDPSIDIAGEGQRALGWYAGGFLAGEGEESWVYAARVRYAGAYQRLIHCLASRHAATNEYDKAIAVFESGLTQDPGNEGFYRGIMCLHETTGERSEAVRTYQRCRQALHKLQGIAPSRDTETIHQRLIA